LITRYKLRKLLGLEDKYFQWTIKAGIMHEILFSNMLAYKK